MRVARKPLPADGGRWSKGDLRTTAVAEMTAA